MKKRNFLTVLGILLAMGITACGGNKASSKSEEKSSQSQPASSVEPAPASSSEPASTPDTSAPEQGSSSSSSAVAHVHVWNLPNKDELEEEFAEVDQEPTCTTAGQKTWYCECGETKQEAIKKLGHDFGEWTNVQGHGPTCTQGTEQERVCSRCSEKETQFLDDALGHDWAETPSKTAKNADGKDVSLKECTRSDAKLISIAFDDYSAKSAEFGSTSSYTSVPEDLRNSCHLLDKNSTISWKINVDREIKGAKISFAALATSSSHGDQEFTDNKYQTRVNGGEYATWTLASGSTYADAGLVQDALTNITVFTADLVRGENTIELKQGGGGYRLLFGGEVRIEYQDKQDEEVSIFAPYKVTFTGEHCKVLVYSTKQYATETPVETNTCFAKDGDGNIVPYDPDDIENQPQVSFQIICDEGYSVGIANVTVTGAQYKNFKQGPNASDGLPDETYFRITKIQGDINIAIEPINGELKTPEATFVTNHCSVVVYKGQTMTDENIDDTPDHFYARDGSTGDIAQAGGQINFKVVPEAGYKWDHGITGEVGVGTVPFLALNSENSGKNFKVLGDNCFRITKVNDDIAVKIRCIPEAGEPTTGHVVTFATEHCTVLVYDTQDTRFAPSALVDNKVLARLDNGDIATYAAEVAGVDANGDGDYLDEGDTAPVAEVKPQVNFIVICDEGYEFNSGIAVGAEAKASNVSFISGTYNKLKNVGDGVYRITKVQGDLTVTITATAIAA